MALELPLLRIGLAGFSLEQQDMLRQLLDQDTATRQAWDFTRPEDADALCINGARTQLLPDGMLRVAAGVTGGRSTLIDPKELQRPIAFARTAQPPPTAARVATIAKVAAIPASIGSVLRTNGRSARAKTKGSTGRMHGLRIVRMPPK